jgi:hypothetical protein
VASIVLVHARMKKLLLVLSLSVVGCAAMQEEVKNVNAPTLVIRVAQEPPAPLDEVKSPAPALGYIWVAGFWDYIGGHHVWRAGRWVEGKAGYEYVRARYEWNGQTWQFHIPHWKKRQVEPTTQVAQAK